MNPSEVLFWKRVAKDLGIEIVTPFEMTFPNGSRITVSALVKNFGAKRGMLVDEDWNVLKPHADLMVECGYGYSAMSGGPADQYERSEIIEVLEDWGWSGAADKKPAWLGNPAADNE